MCDVAAAKHRHNAGSSFGPAGGVDAHGAGLSPPATHLALTVDCCPVRRLRFSTGIFDAPSLSATTWPAVVGRSAQCVRAPQDRGSSSSTRSVSWLMAPLTQHSRPVFASASRFRMASQLNTLTRMIDHLAWEGRAVALALACGLLAASRYHVCVISCGALCGAVPRGARHEFSCLSQSFHGYKRPCFEM